ncbi:hypothetical protein CMUS01_06588 [Colletotrichum musicola]|uniref:Uncharacterized protein n=1 Tax=Colletotrichum musicola TaxID=2175873 RepID=A0A8H6NH22_9PEZI|nr:hypothetical protein CMUS01_06588 [Colletotrichum musicola]
MATLDMVKTQSFPFLPAMRRAQPSFRDELRESESGLPAFPLRPNWQQHLSTSPKDLFNNMRAETAWDGQSVPPTPCLSRRCIAALARRSACVQRVVLVQLSLGGVQPLTTTRPSTPPWQHGPAW